MILEYLRMDRSLLFIILSIFGYYTAPNWIRMRAFGFVVIEAMG